MTIKLSLEEMKLQVRGLSELCLFISYVLTESAEGIQQYHTSGNHCKCPPDTEILGGRAAP